MNFAGDHGSLGLEADCRTAPWSSIKILDSGENRDESVGAITPEGLRGSRSSPGQSRLLIGRPPRDRESPGPAPRSRA